MRKRIIREVRGSQTFLCLAQHWQEHRSPGATTKRLNLRCALEAGLGLAPGQTLAAVSAGHGPAPGQGCAQLDTHRTALQAHRQRRQTRG